MSLSEMSRSVVTSRPSSLLAVLAVLVHEANSLMAFDGDAVIKSVIEKIKPEFQDDFIKFVNGVVAGGNELPRAEFLVYWESDESCQLAIETVLGDLVIHIQRAADAIRQVAYWKT